MPTIVITGLASLLYVIIHLYFHKSSRQAAIIISSSLFLCFSYRYAYEEISSAFGERVTNIVDGAVFIGGILFIVWCLLEGFIIYKTCKTKRKLINITLILNAASLGLIIMPIFNIISCSLSSYNNNKLMSYARDNKNLTIIKKYKPDIYYLIFDRYPSNQALERIFNYDNSKFTQFLSNKGFYVISRALTNYPRTSYSLASSLNVNYLDNIVERVDDKGLFDLIQDNVVFDKLKKLGYEIIHLGSFWSYTRQNRNADININYSFLSEFSMMLYRYSILYPIGSICGLDNRREQWYRERMKFKELLQIPKNRKASFTFGHFILPHHPHVFKRNGDFLPRHEFLQRKLEANFIEQLIYANTKITEFVNTALSESRQPPIIIIQADEGPRPFVEFSARDSNSTRLARQSILNAYFLPGFKNKLSLRDITPVNTFRVIFNSYFGTDYPMLQNRCFNESLQDITSILD